MELREGMGMSVRQFAEYVGISYGTMNELENLSRFPSRGLVEKLRDKLGSAVDEMFPEYLTGITARVSVRTIPEADVLQLSAAMRLRIAGPESELISEERRELIEGSLKRALNDREREVVGLRFGFIDERKWTYREIGEKLNVGVERVRQIEESALRKLRHPAFSRKLRHYLSDPGEES